MILLVSVFPLLLLPACAPRLRVDVTCVAAPQGPRIVMNCADAQSWKEWEDSQKRGT